MTPSDDDAISRRDFLRRAGAASAAALAAVGLGLGLADPQGPPASNQAKAIPGLGDFSPPELAGQPGRMAVAEGMDRTKTFGAALAALGGMGAFVGRGDRVLLKVNAAFASPPLIGATSHPDLVAAAVTACREAGAAEVLVTDNPIHAPETCFDISGVGEAARRAGAKVILPRPELFVPASLPEARLIRDWPVMAGAFAGVDRLLVLTPVKGHHRAGASLNLKNLFGLLGGRRNVFHQDISGIIAELSRLVRPTLCVLDGTVSMVTNGPTGGSLEDLKPTGTMVLSTDPVAADAFGLTLLGLSPGDAPWLAMAEAAGSGTADWRSLAPFRLRTEG